MNKAASSPQPSNLHWNAYRGLPGNHDTLSSSFWNNIIIYNFASYHLQSIVEFVINKCDQSAKTGHVDAKKMTTFSNFH